MAQKPTKTLFVTRYTWDGALIAYMAKKYMPGSETYMLSARDIERRGSNTMVECHSRDANSVVYCDVPVLFSVNSKTHLFTHMASLYLEYEDIETVEKHYSATESTSVLVFAWMQSMGVAGDVPPRCLTFIDDITMWKRMHPRSRDFYESIKSKKPEVSFITGVERMTDAELATLLDKGETMREALKTIIGQLSRNNIHKTLLIDTHPYNVVIVESPAFVNEIAENLLDEKSVYAVVVVCCDTREPNKWNASVRALAGGPIDAGHLASLYGGGGSAGSAGFTFKCDIWTLFTDTDACIKKYSLHPKAPFVKKNRHYRVEPLDD